MNLLPHQLNQVREIVDKKLNYLANHVGAITERRSTEKPTAHPGVILAEEKTMKKNLFRILVMMVIAFSFVLPVRADQPHMQAARSDLQNAMKSLNRATADKGGHREKAMNLFARKRTKLRVIVIQEPKLIDTDANFARFLWRW